MLPTLEEVLAQGPLDGKTARRWGITFPLKAGWKDRLIRQIVAAGAQQAREYRETLSEADQNRFDGLRQAIVEREQLVVQAQSLLDSANAELTAFIRARDGRGCRPGPYGRRTQIRALGR